MLTKDIRLDEIRLNRFRDPIHGFVDIYYKEELSIIDSQMFQRLRRISQLALTKYIYPSAEHSRFVHSLGVMQCATELCRSVKGIEFGEKQFRTIRLAALLHDIGHLPFSHAIEKLYFQQRQKLGHEDVSALIIKQDATISKLVEQSGVEIDAVVSLITKKNIKSEYIPAKFIISGSLDADRADYLLRDSHHCGVNYGKYDFARYKRIFTYNGERDKLYIDEKDIFVAEAMFMARYHYNLQVPYHKTRVAYNIVLEEYFKKHEDLLTYITKNKKKVKKIEDIDLKKFALFDECTIFEHAKQKYQQKDDLAACILRYNHLRPIINLSLQEESDKKNFYSIPDDKKYYKRDITVTIADKETDAIEVKKETGEYVDMFDFSLILKHMKEPIRFGRVFACQGLSDAKTEKLRKTLSQYIVKEGR